MLKTTKSRINYVENKTVNSQRIDHYLSISSKANHWSNFGPLSLQLESRLTQLLSLNEDLRVIACCNATVALHTLVAMQKTLHGKDLRWLTSAFGFYSSANGNLATAEIADCDQQAMLSLNQLEIDTFDGIIATNIFGQRSHLKEYQHFAKQHNKILIVDSAMGFQSGGHVANECISLHHTKPWGFGECGCAIVHKEHEQLFRSLISFGHDNHDQAINRLAINGKISDIACAYVLMWLDQFDDLKHDYNKQYQRILDLGLRCGLTVLSDLKQHPGVPANVPFLLPNPIKSLPQLDIPAARYYYPLADTKQAWDIYKRIINIPCHREMQTLSDDDITRSLTFVFENAKSNIAV